MKIELTGTEALTEKQAIALYHAACITLEVDEGRDDQSEKRLDPKTTKSLREALEKLARRL